MLAQTFAPPVAAQHRTGTALLTGRPTKPELYVEFPYTATHPQSGGPLREMFKAWPGARWQKAENRWRVTGTPRHPDALLKQAGLDVIIDPIAMPGITSLEDVYWPIARLDANGRTVSVRHRLCGYVAASFMLGLAASWDKGQELFRIPVTDVYEQGLPRKNVLWDQPSLDAAYSALTATTCEPGFDQIASDYGRTVSMGPNAKAWAAEHVGTLPEWWSRDLFKFQEPGALSVFLGHRLLADPPGLGKTLQTIAVAAMRRSERILIVCPPLLAKNWGREFKMCGYPGEIAVFQAGRKEPTIPDAGVVIVPDSLITSREELRGRIIDWAPETMAVDEAHRMKSLSAKRTNAILDVAVHVPMRGRIAITGTPVMGTPAELVPLLEFTGHLGPIFGGADAFLKRFCSVTPFGKFNPRHSALGELHLLLRQHVWVRREKSRVLPFLPARLHSGVELVVDAKPYREAHDAVIEKITEWVQAFYEENGVLPGAEEQDAYCQQSLNLVSMLRVASALTKIPAAREMVAEHVANDPDNESPLVVWVHHHEITLALAEQMEELGVKYRILDGQESTTRRQAAVDDYQAGKIQVLIAGIIAAGVGITLTRGYEALFAETDWTPANVTQCMDRQHRIGQTHPVLAKTLVALGTLDEHIQKLQLAKQKMLEKIHGDAQSNVAVLSGGELIGPRDIIRQLVDMVMEKARKQQ